MCSNFTKHEPKAYLAFYLQEQRYVCFENEAHYFIIIVTVYLIYKCYY